MHPSQIKYPIRALPVNFKPGSTDLAGDLHRSAFEIVQGDTLPEILAVILDADDQPVNLATATSVTFQMRPVSSSVSPSSLIVDAAATIVSNVVVDEDDGHSTRTYPTAVKYQWASADTQVAGPYFASFKIQWDDALISTAEFTVAVTGLMTAG